MPKERVYCQSCGMPIRGKEDCGTDATGGLTEDFCCNCFRRGRFTEPHITLEEMTLRVAKTMNQTMGLGQLEAAKMAADLIPRLKRWKKT